MIRRILNVTGFEKTATAELDTNLGPAIEHASDRSLEAMKKPDGSFRTYNEMVAENIPLKCVGQWTAPAEFPNIGDDMQGKVYSVYQWLVFMAEVEVDVKTSKTKVLKMTYYGDHGVIGNQLSVDGQIYGSLSQGIGFALSEDFEDVRKHSTMTGAGFPFIKDIPDDMELHYQQTPESSALTAQQAAEKGPMTSPHAAIINGIPAYPEKMLAGLKRGCA